ncbi:hypothetical protein CGRA01v4_07464 [Colletotrichum graminicola]|nr:hypothetical protein CGRA01v4_07464 [Colletotrichum graminicola]
MGRADLTPRPAAARGISWGGGGGGGGGHGRREHESKFGGGKGKHWQDCTPWSRGELTKGSAAGHWRAGGDRGGKSSLRPACFQGIYLSTCSSFHQISFAGSSRRTQGDRQSTCRSVDIPATANSSGQARRGGALANERLEAHDERLTRLQPAGNSWTLYFFSLLPNWKREATDAKWRGSGGIPWWWPIVTRPDRTRPHAFDTRAYPPLWCGIVDGLRRRRLAGCVAGLVTEAQPASQSATSACLQ